MLIRDATNSVVLVGQSHSGNPKHRQWIILSFSWCGSGLSLVVDNLG